jgi:signal transduction histidine kinase
MRRPRLALGLALIVIGLLDLQALVWTLGGHARVRERAAEGLRDALAQLRPRLAQVLSPGGAPAWEAAARAVVAAGIAPVAETFDVGGRSLAAAPRPTASRWVTDAELSRLRAGEVVLTGGGDSQTLVGNVLLPSGGDEVVIRAFDVHPELAADLRERQRLFAVQGIALLALLAAGALLAVPLAPPAADTAPRALLAYEEAMELLRARGEKLSVEHDEERRRLTGQIEDREALARAGELTAGIVHEMRNGLGTIVGYARLLEKVPETREHARSIREECETLETVVRRFMDFVTRETLSVAEFDLGPMLERVMARESRRHPSAVVRLSAAGASRMKGDEEMLERAFENLVRNALEAAGAKGHVWIEAALTAHHVTVSVIDDGPGLTDEVRRSLRPFFTTKPGGLGLGLPMALKIVKLHGGELTMGGSTRSPRGLTVHVRLPVAGPK